MCKSTWAPTGNADEIDRSCCLDGGGPNRDLVNTAGGKEIDTGKKKQHEE